MEYFPKMLIYRASLLGCKEEGIENVINWFHNRLKKALLMKHTYSVQETA